MTVQDIDLKLHRMIDCTGEKWGVISGQAALALGRPSVIALISTVTVACTKTEYYMFLHKAHCIPFRRFTFFFKRNHLSENTFAG